MKVDAVIDIPDVPEHKIQEMALIPGSHVTVQPNWLVSLDSSYKRPLWLRFYSETDGTGRTEVWIWDATGGKESMHATIGDHEGHVHWSQEDEDGPRLRHQEVMTRGGITLARTTTFVR